VEETTPCSKDVHGYAYVTGYTSSPDLPTTKNAFQGELRAQCSGCTNAFVAKFNVDGDSLVYSTYLGGSSMPGRTFAEGANAIAVDRRGHAYVTGFTNSTDFPIKNAFQPELRSENGNAFVMKFEVEGDSLVYSTYLGGTGSLLQGSGDSGSGIAVDARGRASVTGSTFSTDFPIKSAFQEELKGILNAFVTRIDAAGCALVYSSYLGGSNSGFPGDVGAGIAVDTAGHSYVVGWTNSRDFPTKNAYQSSLKIEDGGSNAFVTEISAH
jgi:beta-propeller repeat-containing protein